MSRRLRSFIGGLSVLLTGWPWGGGSAWAAVEALSGITVRFETMANTNHDYATTGGGSSYFPSGTTYAIRFDEGASNHMRLGSVTVGGRVFDGVALAGQIHIARATNAAITGAHHIVLYEQSSYSGTNILLKSSYAATMEESLRSPMINQGADNVFSDQGDANGNNNNIQRIDYLFPDGLPVHSHIDQRGFLVMDRGGNDRFKIAAVTALDGNGMPSAFSVPVSVMETNWGASGRTIKTIVMRGYTEDGDVQHPSADVSTQPIAGVFLSWQTLGLKTNDLFYGYALAANDTTTNGEHWTQIDDSTYFPTDTSPDSTYGGLDMISGGLMFFDEALNVTLGDFAWDDLDADGIQEAGEPGISNVLVRVWDAASNLAANVRTDTNGVWMSPGHGPGTYFAQYACPAGYEPTARHVGTNAAVDSDADPVTGRSAAVTMANGQTNLTLDAGFFRRASLGDFTWEDMDGDGRQDAGEPGLSNVVVRLRDAASNVMGTATSSASGAYAFTNLAPGAYFVEFEPPAGHVFTAADAGDDAADSDAMPGTNRTALLTLVSGQVDATVDAGFWRPASLGDLTWEDLDGDGQQDAGEAGLSGVEVRLRDAASNVVGTATSSASGAYAFANLAPGAYFAEFEPPAGYVFTVADAGDDAADSDAMSGTNRTALLTLVSGQTDATVDAGLVRPASLGDLTWEDLDFDGQQDGGEGGVSNVVVRLYDVASNVVGTATSSASGAYAFFRLLPGTYFAEFAPPAGYVFTVADAGGDATDSDADAGTGFTAPFVLAAGQTNATVDAGFIRPASIGDRAWVDADFDGQQDAGEAGLSGVEVRLYDAASNMVGTTTSSASGAYAFPHLPAGAYFVGFAPLAGYSFTSADVGADATDSDADARTGFTAPYVLAAGQTNASVDAGFYLASAVSLRLWKSSGLTGNWDHGATNDYYLTLQNTGAVAVAGIRLSDVLPAGAAFVPGSAAIVRMLAVESNAFTETVSDGFGAVAYTNQDGTTNWLGGWSEVGDNGSASSGQVRVRVVGVTNALVFEDNQADNDHVTRTNRLRSGPGRVYTNMTLSFAYRRQDWDMGDTFTFHVSTNGFVGQSNLVFSAPTTAGSDAGFVQVTTNLSNRMGSNVALRLRAGANFANGDRFSVDFITFTNTGYEIATNVMAVYGDGLTVDVVSNLAAATPEHLLTNYTLRAGSSVTVRIRATLGAPMGSPELVNTAVATNPATPPLVARVTNFSVANSVGDRAWIDSDADGVQEGGEPGAAGVVVRLRDAASNLLATAETAADGAYRFENLPTGAYFLEFVAPGDHVISPQGQGGDGARDSDIDRATGRTALFALSGGANDTGRDAGFYRRVSIGDYVWEDANANGQQDEGESELPGVGVTLYGAASNVIATATSSASGSYLFADLEPGSYFVGFTPPENHRVTRPDTGDDATDSDASVETGFAPLRTLESGQEDLTVDAGFAWAHAVGDRVWFDENRDGLQNASETNGIAAVPAALLGTNGIVVAETLTDATGLYLFTNLLAGTYVVRFDLSAIDTNQVVTLSKAGTNDAIDSDVISGRTGDYAWTAPFSLGGRDPADAGDSETAIDLGIGARGSTRVEMAEVWGEWVGGEGRVAWRTESEFGAAGFFVYRVDPETGGETRLNDRLLPSTFREAGATYRVGDPGARRDAEGVYRLEEIELTGDARDLGARPIRFAVSPAASKAIRAKASPRSVSTRAAAAAGPSPVLKVRVGSEGLHGVALGAIAEGMGLAPDEARALAEGGGLKVTLRGGPVPTLLDAARGRILFHAASPVRTWYAHDDVYLISAGEGVAMPRREPGATGGATAFPVRLHFEEDHFLFNMTRMPEDFYFWAGVVSETNDLLAPRFPLDLTGHAGGDVALKVRLMGWSATAQDPDHVAEFRFNGAAVGSVEFDDQETVEAELTVPGGRVLEGVNTLTVSGPMAPGQSHNFFVVDWIEASFRRALSPAAPAASFVADGEGAVSAAAFVEPVALALSGSGAPRWIADAEGRLPFKAWAVADGEARHVVAEAADLPMLAPEPAAADAWFMAETNRIDYLVIASRELAPAARELADLRAGQGLRAGVAVFEDICDLMAGGQRTPEAIPALLRHAAATWAASPRWVVLAGSGHFDFLGVTYDEVNPLPPMLVQAPTGVFASDGLLGDLGGDGLADVAIGRLPAQTPEELTAMIAKIQAYEAAAGAAWRKDVVLVSDNANSAGDFRASNARLARRMTAPCSVAARIDLDQMEIDPARARLMEAFRDGAGFIHYSGHGGLFSLSGRKLLTVSDVGAMADTVRPPVVVALSCLVGRYESPATDSLGEVLMRRPRGGAVAVLGPSGLSYDAPATELGDAFYRAALTEGAGTLGMAFLRARRSLPDDLFTRDTFAVYNLLGDPALRLSAGGWTNDVSAPAQVALRDLAQVQDGRPCAVTAATEPEGLAVRITYDGRAEAPTEAGRYAVTGWVTTAGYEGFATGTLVVTAPAIVTLGALSSVYDGSPKAATAATEPGGLAVEITYDGSATPPTAAGSHAVAATVVDPLHSGSATGVLTIAKAPAAVSLVDLSWTYDGSPKAATAATEPGGLAVEVAYDGSSTPPTAVGVHAVTATVADPNHSGSATGALTIAKAPAEVSLGGLARTYDGAPRAATALTVPAGLAVDLTYDGSRAAPARPGTYAVEGTIRDASWHGAATGALVIAKADQRIDFAEIDPRSAAEPVGLVATASSGLPVAFSVRSGPAVIQGGETLAFTGAGVITVVASQAGDEIWNAAPDVARTFAVSPVAISSSSVNVRENGEGRFFIRLLEAPAGGATVVVARVDGPSNLVVRSGSPRIFQASNGGAWQAVTLAAGDDDNADDERATFRVSVSGHPDQRVEVIVLDDDIGEDLARGATITGRSACQAQMAIDGVHLVQSNYAYTVWTNRADPGTMTLDLKTPAVLTRVRLLLHDWGFREHQYRIETSVDGTDWSLLADAGEGAHDGWEDWWGGEGPVRLLRFTGLSNSANRAVCVAEWEVYGEPWRKAPATVTLEGLEAVYDGTPKRVEAVTEPAGLAVAITYDGADAAPTAAGLHAVVATVVDSNHAGSATGTLVVARADQVIVFPALSDVFSSDVVGVSATASSGLPVVFQVLEGPAELNGGTLTFTGTGTVTVAASQGGDTNWNPARIVVQSFAVEAPRPVPSLHKASVNIREAGEGRIHVRLSMEPASNVLVAVTRSSGSTNAWVKTGALLVFKPSNWNAWQTTTFAAGPDDDAENETAVFRFSVPGERERFVTATVLDDDIGENLALASSGAFISGRNACQIPAAIDGEHVNRTNYAYTVWTNLECPGSMTLDLHASAAVTRMRVMNWDFSPRAHQYRVEASLDGAAWSVVADAATGEHSGWEEWTLDGQPTRYLRFTGLSNSANRAVCVSEWEVYGARTVGRLDQRIEFPPIPDALATEAVTLSATASSGLPVAFAVAEGPAALAGAVLTFTGPGKVTLVASQAGNEAWNPAPPVTVSFEALARRTELRLSASAVNVRESGEGRFHMRLDSAPTGVVVVAVSRTSGDGGMAVGSGSILTFTPSNWSAWKVVTLVAAADGNAAEEAAVFRVRAAGMSDRFVTATAREDDIGENWALASAGASVRGTGASQVACLIDGAHTSRVSYGWTVWTNPASPGAITLALKEPVALSRVRLLNWDWTFRVHRYRIDTSEDGVLWTMLADASAEDHQGWDEWAGGGRVARYLKFTGLSNSANSCVVVSELEVYGERADARRARGGGQSPAASGGSRPVLVVTSDDVAPSYESGWAAVDGDSGTGWVARKPGGGHIAVAYEPTLHLRALEVEVPEGAPTDMQVLTSLDAEEWLPLPEDLENHPVALNHLWLIFPDDGGDVAPAILEIHARE